MDEPRIFLVRVWQGGPRFLASAREAGAEEARWFDSAAQVAAFLAEGAVEDPPRRAASTTEGASLP